LQLTEPHAFSMDYKDEMPHMGYWAVMHHDSLVGSCGI